MCRVFCGAEKSCFFLFLKKNVGTPHVLQGVFIIYVALTTIRITYVHVKGADILIINTQAILIIHHFTRTRGVKRS